MSIVLVSGTDTGAGKTLVTATLAAGLAARGVRLGVAKPVETGCAGPEATDAATLRAAAGSDAPLAAVCPFRFPEPLAPALAAERAGTSIDLAVLVDHLRRRAATCDLLLVEGAGGLLVPLTRAASFADLARMLDASVLLVVGSRLGAINHALLTLEVLAGRGLRTLGYVLSPVVAPGDLAVDTNAALLAASTPVACLGALPWLADAADLLAALRSDDPAQARKRLATLARTHLALDALA